ncbi:MAG: DUF2268 domain-containing putative Zn-dependent protease [Candidatus Promineifilaceae bacterium]
MMDINWIPTNEYYHRILEASDPAVRQQLYLDRFVQPWQQMMAMVGGRFGNSGSTDPLAGAKAWNWLLPEQTAEIAAMLETMETADAWQRGHEALLEAAARFEPYADRIPFNTVEGWLVLADPTRSHSFERGYTGATDWMAPRLIGQFWEPNEYNLPRLGGLLAHEMHHLIRLKAFPWNMMSTSVADYIVLEGTAESFAGSIFGQDKIGYFIVDYDQDTFETARRLIGEGLHKTGFNTIRSYIFGDTLAAENGYEPLGGMPTYGGYTIGYHVIQAYLKRSGRTIEEATFISADEIVAESGFF